jgi:hypothetical protein
VRNQSCQNLHGHLDTTSRACRTEQGSTYRTCPPNRRPSVSVNRSVSRGYRWKPTKFKFQIETLVHSVSIGKPLGKDR